jgi:hypothetical protein
MARLAAPVAVLHSGIPPVSAANKSSEFVELAILLELKRRKTKELFTSVKNTGLTRQNRTLGAAIGLLILLKSR